MNKIPKYCVVSVEPDRLWGMARMREPCMIVELHRVNVGGIIGTYQPTVWPPDVMALTTESKFHASLTKMWRIFEDELAGCDEVWMYQFDLARPLPPFLVLDNEGSDFTAVLDTARSLLWIVDETGYGLRCDMDFRMHPSSPPHHEWPQDHRAVVHFYRAFLARSAELEEGWE